MRGISRHALGVLVLLVLTFVAAPLWAQTGGVRGKITDAEGKPVEGAVVKIEAKGVTRKLEVKTNKKGEYIQIGLYPGEYTISATKDSLGAIMDTRISMGDATEINLRLSTAGRTPDQDKTIAALTGAFDAGVAASRAGNFDESIAKFNEAIALAPSCHDCYYNIGYAHVQKKEYDLAEAAYKKATEIKPDYVEAWNALANVYNIQKKLDEAMAASTKAAELSGAAGAAGGGGGNAPALYNQGVILWNQSKYAEARDKFEAATKADPKYSEAFYRLGMAHVNLGDMPKAIAAFEGYLAADPSGSHADEVKAFIAAMKK